MSKIEEWKAAQNRFAEVAEYVGLLDDPSEGSPFKAAAPNEVLIKTVLRQLHRSNGYDSKYHSSEEFDRALEAIIAARFTALAGDALALLADEAEAARLAAREEASALMVETHRPA